MQRARHNMQEMLPSATAGPKESGLVEMEDYSEFVEMYTATMEEYLQCGSWESGRHSVHVPAQPCHAVSPRTVQSCCKRAARCHDRCWTRLRAKSHELLHKNGGVLLHQHSQTYCLLDCLEQVSRAT